MYHTTHQNYFKDEVSFQKRRNLGNSVSEPQSYPALQQIIYICVLKQQKFGVNKFRV